MKRTKTTKKKLSAEKPILNEEQKQSDEPYGTQWPNTIGAKRHPYEDGLVRDSRGVVM